MKNRQQRLPKPDLMVVLALVVGLGALLSTSAQAENAAAPEYNNLFVSYKGALPALRKRLAMVTNRADGLLRQVESVLPPISANADPVSLSLAAPEIKPAVSQLRSTGGFVVEDDTAMTLIFQTRW